ncbi:MAG: mismatch repair protein MutS domain protein [Acidobacteria bacterium]|nr:mismatch repair protein MutS domain protein [Acidobacteriota bacterium]
MTDPKAEYETRLALRRERMAALDRANFMVSNIRLAIALVGAVLLWLAFVRASISPWWPVAAWLSFGALAAIHAKRLQGFERAKAAERVYLRGLDRLNDRWAGTGRDGASFLAGHSYAGDLDLFGPSSLFELLNTTRTEIGELTLADWLREPAPLDEVRARQAAVEELRGLLDFREDVAVLASESPVGRTGPLAAWAGSPPVRFSTLLRTGLAGASIVTIALAAAVYRDAIVPEWLFAWLFVELGAASVWRRPFHQVLHGIDTPERDLGLLADLLARIESERFSSPRLAALHQTLLTGGVPPSIRIARLRRLVSWLDSTHNMMFAPIAIVLLLRQQLAIAIDRWHGAYGPAVAAWLRAVGDLEALGGLATFAYERPGDPFPELADEGPVYDAEGLGHPLIAGGAAVRNDVRLGGNGPRVIIVSGSNMSGKSTLLRSVGVSVVLALAGAPVTARRLRVSALVLGATLHVEDSLQAGQSRFYAEILRIRTIADAARGPVPMLFLLDEILHGTNSHDRRIGAEGIVRALVGRGAIGLVTTHDLALTELPATLPSAINMHFEDRLEDGKMIFDYRMRPGVVEHSNALALMRAIGLDV